MSHRFNFSNEEFLKWLEMRYGVQVTVLRRCRAEDEEAILDALKEYFGAYFNIEKAEKESKQTAA